MNYTKNIHKLYIISFFFGLMPAYVIERLFWEARGMTIQMVVYAEIIYAATIVLLEVPTGILADKWGRKNMIVVCAFLGSLEFFLLIYSTEFWHFAVVVFLAGIATTAYSGSANAFLYDSLKMSGAEPHFEKELGRINAIDITSTIIAALSGSLLASRFDFELNYWLSFGGMTIAMLFSFTLVEPPNQHESDETTNIREYISTSFNVFRRNPAIFQVVLVGMVTGAAITFIDEFWQLYLDRIGIPMVFFGIFSAATFLLRIPGTLFAYLLKSTFSYRSLLITVSIVFSIGFACIALLKGSIGLIAILVVCLFAGITEPLTTGYLHHRIDSKMRATVDSFQSLGLNVIMILTSLGFGYFSTRYDLFGGFGFIAIFCTIFLLYLTMDKKELNK